MIGYRGGPFAFGVWDNVDSMPMSGFSRHVDVLLEEFILDCNKKFDLTTIERSKLNIR